MSSFVMPDEDYDTTTHEGRRRLKDAVREAAKGHDSYVQPTPSDGSCLRAKMGQRFAPFRRR